MRDMLSQSGEEARKCYLNREAWELLFSQSNYDIAKVLKIFIPDCPLLGCYSMKFYACPSQLFHYSRICIRNAYAFSRLMERVHSPFFKTYISD